MVVNRVTKNQYNNLKINYLSKKRNMYSLYNELNKESEITKHVFFELINKIREEEGLKKYYK